MKRIKKVLRFAGMVMLISLACFGLGISGPAPVSSGREKHPSENVETKEEKDQELKP
ncbi:hypothetical protein [Pedobacter sp. UYP1]|uniref:hypothetical protein n=1 Tax=Pedobacter sp. UYP1 TaxID=1756396 RepID=UPI00339133F3